MERKTGKMSDSSAVTAFRLYLAFTSMGSSMPTVSYDVNYIILNPDRLFKTVNEVSHCNKMLWRYVGIIQGCSDYVLYIIS